MGKPLYVFLPKARDDAILGAKYIARDDLEVANAFLDALEKTCERLAGMPAIGSLCDLVIHHFKAVRLLPIKGFEKYLIFYRPTPHGVEILRVLHSRRDIPVVFEE